MDDNGNSVERSSFSEAVDDTKKENNTDDTKSKHCPKYMYMGLAFAFAITLALVVVVVLILMKLGVINFSNKDKMVVVGDDEVAFHKTYIAY